MATCRRRPTTPGRRSGRAWVHEFAAWIAVSIAIALDTVEAMPPAVVVVKVVGPYSYGSGVFITDRLVVTAGHVIQPSPGARDPDDFEVHVAGAAPLEVTRIFPMPRWAQMFHPDSDMAVVRVKSPRAGLVVPYELDPEAVGRAVVVGGFRAPAPGLTFPGTVTSVASNSGYGQLSSSDLAFPSGVSGGPILDGGTAIGIATRAPPAPGNDVLIGLPFLDDSLAWLIANCP